MLATIEGDLGQRIDAALAEKPDGILEMVADKCCASLLEVLRRLPPEQVREVPGENFESAWRELAAWGDVLLIVHTPDIVLECTAPLPSGAAGHGYFNVHGESAISGHIKSSNCATIALVDRQFHGRRSCSVVFLNGAGNAMFKVFVVRGKDRQLDPVQLEKFAGMFAPE